MLSSYIKKGLTPEAYNTFFEAAADSSRAEDKYYNYTKINWSRHQRNSKKVNVSESFNQLNIEAEALLITEPWCGDAAQSVAVIVKICATLNIKLRIILRDEHTDLIDAYLTNGGRSIPKLIVFNPETDTEFFSWGPRPKEAQDMVIDFKTNGTNQTYDQFSIELQKWYNANKTEAIQSELLELFKTI